MRPAPFPIVKDLVLVGGGHSHVIALKRIGMRPIPGVRVTVIARDIDTPYSGMLPGLIAGHYTFDQIHIDLGPLAQFAGARFYHDDAIGLDLTNSVVHCQNRPPVHYDVLSIDIGVTPAFRAVGAKDHAVPVKPIGTLAARLERLRARVRCEYRPLKIGVVGAGAAGVELTLAIQFALCKDESSLENQTESRVEHEFHLFSAAETVLPTHNRRTQRVFLRILRERGVHVHLRCRVVQVKPDGLVAEDKTYYPVDEIVWATEARAQQWPGVSGLEVDELGFICVDDTLQSRSHQGVFAAGDIAAVVNHPREKSGVFAVRQGAPLEANLRRSLKGQPLKPFMPQRKFLSLVSTGDQYAVASRGRWSIEGGWVWRWKDWIDQRFIKRFRDLPPMNEAADRPSSQLAAVASPDVVRELSTVAMRCGGCGSKVGANILNQVLKRLQPIDRADVVLGLDALDDASIERVPAGLVAVRTVDAFRSIVDDPYTFGRIAANHCLGDVYAMGADPITALALATIPLGPECKMEQLLEELLSGAVDVLNAADTALVGGHTKEGLETELGLALTGVGQPDHLLRKGGMKPGDHLLVTKPIGTGTLFAAHMRMKARGCWIDAAVEMMLQSSREAGNVLRANGATACTDVTGFGLLGHLLEMTRASQVDACLRFEAIPLLDGAAETVAGGYLSSLQPQNARLRSAIANIAAVRSQTIYSVLFDPQTAGGLLASVPADSVTVCLNRLHAAGYLRASDIGTVEPLSDRAAPIHIEV